MKRYLILLSVVFGVPGGFASADSEAEQIRQDAENRYFDAVIEAKADFRMALAKAVSGCDRIEVFLLDFEVARSRDFVRDQDAEYFPVKPYQTITKVLKSRELSDEERRLLLQELPKNIAIKKSDGGAFCHFPIHGVRAYSDDTLIFESTFCWECINFSVDYLSYESGWVGIWGKSLQNVFEKLMPIPKEELLRFDAAKKRGFQKEGKSPDDEKEAPAADKR